MAQRGGATRGGAAGRLRLRQPPQKASRTVCAAAGSARRASAAPGGRRARPAAGRRRSRPRGRRLGGGRPGGPGVGVQHPVRAVRTSWVVAHRSSSFVRACACAAADCSVVPRSPRSPGTTGLSVARGETPAGSNRQIRIAARTSADCSPLQGRGPAEIAARHSASSAPASTACASVAGREGVGADPQQPGRKLVPGRNRQPVERPQERLCVRSSVSWTVAGERMQQPVHRVQWAVTAAANVAGVGASGPSGGCGKADPRPGGESTCGGRVCEGTLDSIVPSQAKCCSALAAQGFRPT